MQNNSLLAFPKLSLIFFFITSAICTNTLAHPKFRTNSRASYSHAHHKTEMHDANDFLVLRFDNSLDGDNGEMPTLVTGTSFQAGVNNQGLLLPNPNQLFYPSSNNINATEGSFECWLKPSWNGNDGQGHFILKYGGGGGILIGKDGANNMRIILNRFGVAPGGEVGVAFNVGAWLANEWHHIAFTWSNSNKFVTVYIDGTLRQQNSFTANLPAINSTTLQIGGDGAGSYIQAVVDDLRISSVARTAQEIANHMISGLTISSWSFNPATSTIEMYPTWFYWVPLTLSAVTNIGNLSLPVLAASWLSSDSAVALMDISGRFKALAPGTATLTGLVGGQANSVTINVLAPALAPAEETIEPFMGTPANGYLYRVPVVIIRYFPTRDGINLDPVVTGTTATLATLKATEESLERRHKYMLEEGSKFRGYNNPNSLPSLGYQVIKTITVYEDIPPGFSTGTAGVYFPDYNQIFTRFNAAHLVNDLGVKEFWIAHYHNGRIAPNESNMSSPTTGDISNSYRTNGDQPMYSRTYVTYGINYTRSQAEATHNHGHQLESILSHVNQRQDGNTNLWWQQFARAANNPPARAGNTHFPPNATQDYDYTNLNLVASDIMDWRPSGGTTTNVNANTWGNVPYAWPGGVAPPQEVESKWYIFWFQSMAGRGNTIPYNSNKMTNWWQFTGDWDAAIQAGIGLYEPSTCNYTLSFTSQSVAANGGTVNLGVACGSGCKWISSSNEPSWITVTSGRTGNGNGSVVLTVAQNFLGARTGTVAIGGQLFTVNQAAGTPSGDTDGDGIPDAVEIAEGTNPLAKDNDIFTNNRLFVMQQYRDFLGREGDTAGIQGWVNLLTNNSLTRAQVIQSFFNSPEFQQYGAPIVRLYFAYFQRIPDYPGQIGWTEALRNGTSLDAISQTFATSPEFIQTYGNLNNTQFVTLVYQNVLNRTPSQAEINAWVALLNQGASRGQVMTGFSESPEFKLQSANKVFVVMMYVGMLRRAPEQAGFDGWVALLNGGTSQLVLTQSFLDAPEYHNRFLP